MTAPPTRQEVCFYTPVYTKEKEKMAYCVPTKDFLEPSQDSLPPSISLVEDQSVKWIVPTDNMRPKFDDEYTH